MPDAIDLREISNCSCLHVRRTARRLTRIYDQALEPAGLTVNQFGLLANLYGAGSAGLSMGALADRLGMDPTTLNRDLKPLWGDGLVRDAADPGDRRVRLVLVTAKGRARLAKAVPHWRRAQRETEARLGREPTQDLNALLELATAKLAR
jgi:DNA-binding MarR family transcriptional regulator